MASSAANEGGGIYSTDGGSPLDNYLWSSIIAQNSAPNIPDYRSSRTIIEYGSNFIGVPSGAGLIESSILLTGDPILALRGNYGGPADSRPPLFGSPALDPSTGSTGSNGFANPVLSLRGAIQLSSPHPHSAAIRQHLAVVFLTMKAA
ncbi:MAG TPA: hypothetical protein DEA90_14510 [Opitutae bacterium]|nr:hypothetical protein [Puniceicoccaceae bacterium]HBR95370.1 hypothetical protein [Opitutae bacterium]